MKQYWFSSHFLTYRNFTFPQSLLTISSLGLPMEIQGLNQLFKNIVFKTVVFRNGPSPSIRKEVYLISSVTFSLCSILHNRSTTSLSNSRWRQDKKQLNCDDFLSHSFFWEITKVFLSLEWVFVSLLFSSRCAFGFSPGFPEWLS